MSKTMYLVDSCAVNGRYFIGYVPKNKIDVVDDYQNDCDIVYKCYIPFTGKVIKTPEMSKYFFYNQLQLNGIKKIVITSDKCNEFLGDYVNDFRACEYKFEYL